MALPGSGPLSLSDINVELGNSPTASASLHTMSLAAGKSTPDAISDFYNYSSGWIVDYASSPTYTINTDDEIDGYSSLAISGWQSGQIATLTLNATFNESTPSVTAQVYYSKNSTSSWTALGSWSISVSNIPLSIPNVNYNDVIRIRMHLTALGPGGTSGNLNTTLTGGTMTTGTGSITASGSISWSEFAFTV